VTGLAGQKVAGGELDGATIARTWTVLITEAGDFSVRSLELGDMSKLPPGTADVTFSYDALHIAAKVFAYCGQDDLSRRCRRIANELFEGAGKMPVPGAEN